MAFKMKGSPLKKSPLYKQDLNMDSTLGDVGNKVKNTLNSAKESVSETAQQGIKNLKNTTIKDGLKTIGKGVMNVAMGGGLSTLSNIYNKVRAKDASTGTAGGLRLPSMVEKQKPISKKRSTMTKTLKPLPKKKPHSRPVNKIKAQGIEKNVKTAPLKHTKKKSGKPKGAKHLGLHQLHGTHDKFPSLGEKLGKVVNKVKDVALDVKDKVVDNVNDLVTTVKNGDSPKTNKKKNLKKKKCLTTKHHLK